MNDPPNAHLELHEHDDWLPLERPSPEQIRLQIRILAFLLATIGGFILSGVSFAHGCLRGSRLIEGAAPFVGGLGCGLAIVSFRRTWVGVVIAAAYLAIICWVLAPWYMAWAHGRLNRNL
jgi:hypothetical protein